jgi:hypothetical protein
VVDICSTALMSDYFFGSRLKVKRAYKHISDIDSLLQSFINSDFYDLSVQKDAHTGENLLYAAVKVSLPAEECALILGDALHNLRSALDFLYYESVLLCHGTPTNWTRFPIANSRDKLVVTVDAALEKKQITRLVRYLLLEVVKPYQAGNVALWTLHHLDMTDKHELLIPVLKLMIVNQVSLEDEQNRPLDNLPRQFLFSENSMSWLKGTKGTKVQVKSKGHAAIDVLLAKDSLKKIQPVVPTLHWIAKEVNKTIELFESFFGDTAFLAAIEDAFSRLGRIE